jgi:hypothetical protein
VTLQSWRGPLLALSCLAGPPAWAEEPAAAGAQGYLGFGLVLVSHTLSTPLGDGDSSGFGVSGHGAGHSAAINESLDIGFTGQVAIMGRAADETDEEFADVMYEVDGGLRISELLYLTLGYTTQSTAYDTADVSTTYSVIPVGVGVLRTTDTGYLLAQLRLGGGRLTNDQDDASESVGYVGLRGVFQQGADDGVQFMVAVGWDRYDIKDFDFQDDFLRVDFGLGFGL